MLQTFTYATPEALDAVREEMAVRQTTEVFLLFSLGSQFDHLIKLALERLGVFCLVADPATVCARDVEALNPKGIILSGGPASVHTDPPPFDCEIFDLCIPTLGICLGFQLWAQHAGLRVYPANHAEFSTHLLHMTAAASPLFAGLRMSTRVLHSHRDQVIGDLDGLVVLGSTEHAPIAAANLNHLWGVQFHPEVTETVEGMQMFENFCFRICGATDRFSGEDAAARKIQELHKQVQDATVLLALSGGTDSAVVAYLLKHAMEGTNGQLHAVYIKGLDRDDDEQAVRDTFGEQSWITLTIVDATSSFLFALEGKQTMSEKRAAMSALYGSILKVQAQRIGAQYIAQGTLYADVSESGGGYRSGAAKATIKGHHNVGHKFGVPELTPLIDCVKDGGRLIGRAIGVPEILLVRHPFPGPGLVVRIEGEVKADTLRIARAIDRIYIEELRQWALYDTVWQAGAVLTQSVVTCTKGDGNAEGRVVALWAVWSTNGFTASVAELPYDFLHHVSRRITNEVPEVGAVTYRTSAKPPATLEWG